MNRYEARARELRAIVTPHYNCAQSVVVPFIEDAGYDEKTALKFAANFGQGMRMAGTCGAVTGGLMVLGLFGADDPAVVTDYYRRVKANHDGFLDCASLLKINHDKGLEKKPHCDAMVYECVNLVEQILEEQGLLNGKED